MDDPLDRSDEQSSPKKVDQRTNRTSKRDVKKEKANPQKPKDQKVDPQRLAKMERPQ